MTQDVGLCGVASSPASAKRPPFGGLSSIPQAGCGEKGGKEGKQEGTLLSIPQRNLVSPTNDQSS